MVFSSTARPEGANRDAQLDNLYLCSFMQTHEELACRSRHRFLEPIHNVKEVETNVSPPRANPGWKLFVFISGDEGADSGFGLFVKALPGNRSIAGGAYRDRTDDLKLAKLALSQLS